MNAPTKLRQRRWARVALALSGVVALLAVAFWLSLPDVKPLATANPSTTAFIELRRREAADANRSLEIKWTWRPLARISPLLIRAVLHAEDARFFQHEGVDWEAVRDTAERDWKERSLGRGGSTITQQVAKNLYLSPSRSVVRKLRELFIAWRLEDELEKERVLELYCNIAEWGPGVFGAEAAARYWFGRSAAELKAHQAARLAIALPNPLSRSPRKRSRALDRKAARLVRAMHRGGLLSEAQLVEALSALGQRPTIVAPPPSAGEHDEEPLAAPGPGSDEQQVEPAAQPSGAPPAPSAADHEGGPELPPR